MESIYTWRYREEDEIVQSRGFNVDEMIRHTWYSTEERLGKTKECATTSALQRHGIERRSSVRMRATQPIVAI